MQAKLFTRKFNDWILKAGKNIPGEQNRWGEFLAVELPVNVRSSGYTGCFQRGSDEKTLGVRVTGGREERRRADREGGGKGEEVMIGGENTEREVSV